jgi:hypothetical protein
MRHLARLTWLRTGILAFGLALLPMAYEASAQETGGAGGTAGTGTGGSRGDARRDNGFDMGWLGLVGLAGLAGLMRRDDHRRTNG